jgi:UMP-CMP kinase
MIYILYLRIFDTQSEGVVSQVLVLACFFISAVSGYAWLSCIQKKVVTSMMRKQTTLCSTSPFLALIVTCLVLAFSVCSKALEANRRPFRVSFVLGGPAAGKSTQCTKLVSDYGCVHLSAGDLLREERASGSELAQMIESYINEGAIVPVAVTLDLIKNAMERSRAKRFLIDGFPRNEDNLEGWEGAMKDSCIVDSILFLDCPEDECERRIIERAKTSGRSDDNLTTLKKRFKTFQGMTMPVVRSFEHGHNDTSPTGAAAAAGTVYRIAGDRPIETVYREVKRAYEEMVSSELLQLTRDLLKAEDKNDEEACRSFLRPDFSLVAASYSQAQVEDAVKVVHKLSSISRPHVRLMGKSAVVSYVRLVQRCDEENRSTTTSSEETRIWHLDDNGEWRNVHIHSVVLP